MQLHRHFTIARALQSLFYIRKEKSATFKRSRLLVSEGNITAIEVPGNFDDCQRMVKKAFSDQDILAKRSLSSANSINIARLLPQICYYGRAFAQLPKADNEIVCSVPSGNFGNLTAGTIAKRMGLPFGRFVAATNVNDIVPRYLENGVYQIKSFQETLSNAMDIAEPGNFSRVQYLHDHNLESIRREIIGFRATDSETEAGLIELYGRERYVADPHGIIAYLGLRALMEKNAERNITGIFLETAHPIKFQNTVERVLQRSLPIPAAVQPLLKAEKKSIAISAKYEELKSLLLRT